MHGVVHEQNVIAASMKNPDMSKYDLDDRGLRASSSLSSHLSEEGGGKLKRSSSSRETMMSRCATAASLPLMFDPNTDPQLSNKKKKSSAGLQNSNRASMPTIGVTTRSASRRSLNQNVEWECIKPKDSIRRISSVSLISSDENEEWDCCPNPRDVSMNVFSHGRIRPPPKPSLKSAINERPSDLKRSARRVIFSQTQIEIYIDCFDDINIKWYSASECDRFKDDATARAAIIERTMKYASSHDNTYNSSTGLTAPSVLKEYLSNPEEIIGIEHLLSGQKTARESLKRHHKSTLVKELSHQRQEGCSNPLLLAEMLSVRLRNTSNIASHMAQERATYITLLV